MAYGTKYIMGWVSPKGGVGTLEIAKKDYSGDIETLTLYNKSIEISNNWEDTENPIVGLRIDFSILNKDPNYFHLDELLILTEREFKVIVKVTEPYVATIFEGFLNVDSNSHGYLHKQALKLVASSYLSKLEFLTNGLIKIQRNVTLINLINAMLKDTGAEFNIRVNCKMVSLADAPLPAGKTLFNLNGINTEAFWETDNTYKNSFDILEAILLPLNCFIYWLDGYWYIEQFTDIWNETVEFVEYDCTQTYDANATGTIVVESREILDVHSLRFRDTSQERNVVPGNRLLTVKYNSEDSLLVNLFAPILRLGSPIVHHFDNSSTGHYPLSSMDIRFREWSFFGMSGYFYHAGLPSTGITNGVQRVINWDGDRLPPQMGTAFHATVNEETTFDISFTYTEEQGELKDVAWSNPSGLADLQIFFSYMLFYKLNGELYTIVTYNDNKWWTWKVTDYYQYAQMNVSPEAPDPTTKSSCPAMTIVAQGSNFDKKINGFTLSANIKVGEVGLFQDGQIPSPGITYQDSDMSIPNFLVVNKVTDFYFVLGWEVLWKHFPKGFLKKEHWSDRNIAKSCHFGDFKLITSNDVDYDYIEGSINTDFLNKKDFEFFIGDNVNLNYTNGLLYGESLTGRTKLWTREDLSLSDAMPLIDVFFTEKFRMYNATKQIIKSNILSASFLRPFSLYQDSKQGGKKFILTEYLMNPTSDYWEVSLLEYDNDSDVTIIDAT